MGHSTDDELFDVVDSDDVVIGQMRRADVHAQRLFHRAVHLFVFHPEDGRVFLQKRSRWKDTAAGKWSTSCAGHVDAGESYGAAVVREAEEELGLKLEAVPEVVTALRPVPELGNEFVHVFRVAAAGPFIWPEEEIEDGRWWKREEIEAALCEAPGQLAGSFRYLWEKLQGLL